MATIKEKMKRPAAKSAGKNGSASAKRRKPAVLTLGKEGKLKVADIRKAVRTVHRRKALVPV